MKNKIWIDSNLVLRWAEWPKEPEHKHNGTSTMFQDDVQKEWEVYYDALEKAKAEAVCVEDTYEAWAAIGRPALKGMSDTFINFEGEMEAVNQYYVGGAWRDCIGDPVNYMDDYPIRRIARLKKPENDEAPQLMQVWDADAKDLKIVKYDPAKHSLKAKILEGFKHELSLPTKGIGGRESSITGYQAVGLLIKVLDELGVK